MRNEIKRIWILAAVLAAMALPVGAADYYAVGDKGGDVLLLQKQLIKRGYDVEADGVFSKDMAKAVSKFQKDQKIQVSGKVGGWTYYLLTGKRTLMPKDSGSKAVQKPAKSKKKPVKRPRLKGRQDVQAEVYEAEKPQGLRPHRPSARRFGVPVHRRALCVRRQYA